MKGAWIPVNSRCTDYAGQAEWPLVSIETADLDAIVADLAARGVATAKEVPYSIDHRGISTQDGIRIAWYTDPTGRSSPSSS